jgi:hypothetical protein
MPRDPRDDRRAASRYATKGPPAFLGWYEGDVYRTTAVKLLDVSLLGIKVEAEAFPPKEGTIWLCLAGQRPSQWIEVGVVECRKERRLISSRRLIRLQFLESCPYEVFKEAIEGFSHEVRFPATTLPGNGMHERDWC